MSWYVGCFVNLTGCFISFWGVWLVLFCSLVGQGMQKNIIESGLQTCKILAPQEPGTEIMRQAGDFGFRKHIKSSTDAIECCIPFTAYQIQEAYKKAHKNTSV